MPTEREIEEFKKICEAPVIQLLMRNKNFGEVNFEQLMIANSRNAYRREDIEKAADLVKKCLMWLPQDRISAADAMRHPFFN